jgi:hypothetical protein
MILAGDPSGGSGQQIGRAQGDFNRAGRRPAILIGPGEAPIRLQKLQAEEFPPLRNEWIWAALLFACPFVIFALAEAVGLARRRRQSAVAQRAKEPRRG